MVDIIKVISKLLNRNLCLLYWYEVVFEFTKEKPFYIDFHAHPFIFLHHCFIK